MKFLGEILQLTSQFLKQKGNTSHRRIAEQILSHVLGVDRLNLYLQYDRPLVELEIVRAREILKKVASGYPIEYVCGCVDFLGCRIEVDKRVLIPRPETEIMAHEAIQYIKALGELGKGNQEDAFPVSVLDLCCGSGCLGLAVKKSCPDSSVMLIDLSEDALRVAEINAKHNKLDVVLLQSDLVEKSKGLFSVVLCNPPYISEEAYQKLDPSVREWEPKMALCGGVKGTEFYERLAHELPRVLEKEAKCFFEIGYDQKEALTHIFNQGPWSIKIKNDWAGHPRFAEIDYLNAGKRSASELVTKSGEIPFLSS